MKYVTANEKFFHGHFLDYPVMPGILIVEALVQLSAVIMLMKDKNRGKIRLFTGSRTRILEANGRLLLPLSNSL